MKHLLTASLLLFAFAAFAQTRVMTYNIRNSRAADGVNKWNKRKYTLANLILKVNPDVLGTQEVLPDQLKDLKKMMPAFSAYGVGRNNGKHSGEHSAIFYKTGKYELLDEGNFWLSETPNIPGSKSWDAAITRICTWVKLKVKNTNNVLVVFNTHFDHRGKEARFKSAALLCRMIDSLGGTGPVIVTGDFNFRPDSPAYAEMVSRNHRLQLTDAYHPDAPDYTDCGFEVSNKNCSHIDYIFHNSRMASSNYTVHTDNNGTYYPSDHLPVSVELNLILF